MILIKAFGQIREQLGSDIRVEAEMQDVKSLREYLRDKHPEISWSGIAVAVNKRYAEDDAPLCQGDEVALIPPVSGG
jgi:molybdopterin synthase sulfur carrier subunit